MHIAIITAGGAGMFCGSCMHDNTWARALMDRGAEVSLIPTYTPIRVDEHDESLHRVFLGGINIYLNSQLSWWRRMPQVLTAWLDGPGVIRAATRWSVSNDARQLGELTLSMLRGEHGPHRDAVETLARFLQKELRPDVVIFSNALLSGALNVVKERLNVPVLCTLQGDDVFLDSLIPPYKQQVTELLSERARGFDGFLTHSQFYSDYMARYLGLDRERFSVLPLGIDVDLHTGLPERKHDGPLTVGYFARIAPEKGLHRLAEAFSHVKTLVPDARLRIGGFLGKQYRAYFNESLRPLRQFGDDVKWIGSPAEHAEKVAFFNSIDLLSVPTEFLEPKGLYVLEALANGVPVVQPCHGAFPEVIEKTKGGLLVPPGDPAALGQGIASLADEPLRLTYAGQGWEGIRAHFHAPLLADRTLEVLQSYVRPSSEETNQHTASDSAEFGASAPR